MSFLRRDHVSLSEHDLCVFQHDRGFVNGKVICVVPAGMEPQEAFKQHRLVSPEARQYSFVYLRAQKPRKVESYLVANVDRPEQRWLHWPRTYKKRRAS